jgi:Trk-type K+ transport system membrane component
MVIGYALVEFTGKRGVNMRSITIIIGLICAFLFGAMGAQNGFDSATVMAFLASLSAVAYAGLSGSHRGESLTFDRLTQF